MFAGKMAAAQIMDQGHMGDHLRAGGSIPNALAFTSLSNEWIRRRFWSATQCGVPLRTVNRSSEGDGDTTVSQPVVACLAA